MPVLSEHITLIQPEVSAATNLRIRALDFASFTTFKVSEIAAIDGRPSGTAATIKTTASKKASCTVKKFTLPNIANLKTDNKNT